MRGQVIQDEPGLEDPLLRAIAEFRDQIDRLIDDQKTALGGLLSSFDEEPALVEAVAPLARPSFEAPRFEPPLPPPVAAAEPSPRTKRAAAPASFERIDEPSPTPPRPVAVAAEAPAAARSDDPRERLDALAKRLDRRLRQANAPAPDGAGRNPE